MMRVVLLILLLALPAWAEKPWKPVTIAPSGCSEGRQRSPFGRCVPIVQAPRRPERPLTEPEKAHRKQLEDELRERRRTLGGKR